MRRAKKNKKRKQKMSFIDRLIIIACCIAIAFCAYKIAGPLIAYKTADDEYRKIKEKTVTKTDKALKRYIDFKRLKAINKDIIAWIYVPGTYIDYPVMKGKDNSTYLRTNTRGRYSYSGSIFMETLCKSDFTSPNTIIYGHNMRDGSMFATLNRFSSQSFLNKHHKIYIYLPDADRSVNVYDIFSYNITLQSQVLYTTNPPSFKAYVKRAKQGAKTARKVSTKKKKRTLMLSTCYTGYEAYRRVAFSVLEKNVKRPKKK